MVTEREQSVQFYPNPYLSWGKTGQIAHVPSSSSGTTHKELSLRVTLLRRLVGSEWGADAKTRRKAALFLVYLTAEYCTPVCCRSALTRFIESVLYDALCHHRMPASHSKKLLTHTFRDPAS